jgi:hypothetical protein
MGPSGTLDLDMLVQPWLLARLDYYLLFAILRAFPKLRRHLLREHVLYFLKGIDVSLTCKFFSKNDSLLGEGVESIEYKIRIPKFQISK